MNYGPKVPLHLQNTELAKALSSQTNPSWESFRPHRIHDVQYKDLEERAGSHHMALMRRYPNGELDYIWAKDKVVDAIHKLQTGVGLTPMEMALLTVVLPVHFRMVEPQQAQIMTQLAEGEKSKIAMLVDAHMKAEENWNAGRGGGSVEGRAVDHNGTP